MKTRGISKQARLLHSALLQRGIEAEIEKWDEHKHIDLSIESAALYIEIDGDNHYTDPDTIMRDLRRDFYSEQEGYDTMRVPNQLVDRDLDALAAALAEVTRRRISDSE